MVQKQDVSDFKRTINHVYSPHVCLLATCLWSILHLQSLIKSTFSLTLPIFYLSLNDKFRSMKKEGKLEFRLLSVLNISGKIFSLFFVVELNTMDPDSNRAQSVYHGISKWIQEPTCSSGRQIRNFTSVLQPRSRSHEENYTSITCNPSDFIIYNSNRSKKIERKGPTIYYLTKNST